MKSASSFLLWNFLSWKEEFVKYISQVVLEKGPHIKKWKTTNVHFHVGAERKDKEEIYPVPDPSVCFSPECVIPSDQSRQDHNVCPSSIWTSNSHTELD